ncbi:MAG: hypothetical protein ACTSY1_10155 [Alphaproteobacteria bacterium]
MRVLKSGFSVAVLLLAAGALGACQAGGATSGATLSPGAPAVASKSETKLAGLSVYKRYNTTEKLCKQTCRGQSRCVKQTFTPLREINGYVAGQCQLHGR